MDWMAYRAEASIWSRYLARLLLLSITLSLVGVAVWRHVRSAGGAQQLEGTRPSDELLRAWTRQGLAGLRRGTVV